MVGIPLLVISSGLYWWLTGTDPLSPPVWPLLLALPVVFFSMPAHELIHAAAHMSLGRLRWTELDVRFTVVAAKKHEYLAVYRAVLIAPGLILFLVALVAGLTFFRYGASGLTIGAALAGADSDLRALWASRGMPGSAVVLDRPVGEEGCDVWPPSGAEAADIAADTPRASRTSESDADQC